MADSFWSRFERQAFLYEERCLKPVIEKCPALKKNPWDSLRFFMSYAFEHQGRSPDYVPAAMDTIAALMGKPLDDGSAAKVWDGFCAKLKDKNLNSANNPLCPNGTPYLWQHKGTLWKTATKGVSAVELVTSDLQGQCIVTWAAGLMRRGHIQQAHSALVKINGVGPKIASFFLRRCGDDVRHHA